MTAAKDKVTAFLAEYGDKVQNIKTKIQETSSRLEDLQKAEFVLKSVELPSAIDHRVLEGDASREKKIKRELDKVTAEIHELQEDLVVLQAALSRYQQKAADQVEGLKRIFRDEKEAVAADTFTKLKKAREAYVKALEDTQILHDYKEIDRQIGEVDSAAGHRVSYSDFPIHDLKISELAVDRREVNQVLKRLK